MLARAESEVDGWAVMGESHWEHSTPSAPIEEGWRQGPDATAAVTKTLAMAHEERSACRIMVRLRLRRLCWLLCFQWRVGLMVPFPVHLSFANMSIETFVIGSFDFSNLKSNSTAGHSAGSDLACGGARGVDHRARRAPRAVQHFCGVHRRPRLQHAPVGVGAPRTAPARGTIEGARHLRFVRCSGLYTAVSRPPHPSRLGVLSVQGLCR